MRINKNLFKEEVLYHIEKGTIPKVVGEELIKRIESQEITEPKDEDNDK